MRKVALTLYRYALMACGFAFALLGLALIFIPMFGVVLFWVAAAILTMSNWGAAEEHEPIASAVSEVVTSRSLAAGDMPEYELRLDTHRAPAEPVA